MASRIMDAYTTNGTHAVGNLNSWKVRVVPYGAKVATAAIDNFTIGELGFNADGERIVKQLADKANKGVLVAASERRYIDGETMADFYNAVDEQVRTVILDEGLRFESSAYSKNTGVTTMSNGMVAHFDVATKKFIVSDSGTPHADYATSVNQYVVVATEDETDTIDGQKVVRFEVIK